MFVWWRDVLRESTLEGHHTKVVQLGPRYGFILFIVSEVMFLFALFRASSHSSLAPTVEIGGIWPPKGIAVLDPREIPFLNTLIPLSSGAAVTWAHHAILAGKEKRAVYALVATVSLALVFTAFQGMEYYQAPPTISDSIYGSTFFLATGFHGFHVIIGTLFSIICGIRQYLGHLTKEHHVGFEAAAWYWHFVDVVRLFPFVSIYWWGEEPNGSNSSLAATKANRPCVAEGTFCSELKARAPSLPSLSTLAATIRVASEYLRKRDEEHCFRYSDVNQNTDFRTSLTTCFENNSDPKSEPRKLSTYDQLKIRVADRVEGGILYSIAYAPASDEIEVGSRCVFLRSACHRRMLAKSEEL
ncbi:unnamed protein product [Lactuca saligna]|uniref:Cytochrome c oxidase subunit 3 n=1 Tax=Lactuca saligna TaxID=75948 RepID=A0AA35UR73_LACSI|nr:unnamed protein product [Lactuca saligna]